MNKYKFSRKIRLTDDILPYKEKNLDTVLSVEREYAILNNCHWGALKLLYSEIEFLNLVGKYINIDECLVLYVGAQPGFRLKYLFIEYFFPKIHMLLYDPLPFDIEENEQIIIKTQSDGWFSDEKIKEVLEIANGRKILYISDIRMSADDSYTKEYNIHDDMQKQQKWGIMMGAEFMLLKFRMFFYNSNPNEIDFINNNLVNEYKDKVVFKEDTEKQNDKTSWMLYLKGSIYSQLYAHLRSTETRLFVKKIKYHKDAKKYSKEEQEKYKMIYYNNLTYEGILNNFNMNVRNKEIIYKKSDKLVKYMPGNKISYTSASEYYIINQYLKRFNKKQSFQNILKTMVHLYTFLNNKYNNNLIICITKIIKLYYKEDENVYKKLEKNLDKHLDYMIKSSNKKFINIKKTKYLTEKEKIDYIKSFRIHKNNEYFKIDMGVLSKK